MLYRYKRFLHPIDRLQQYICHFMRAARMAADAGKSFRVATLCHADFLPFVNRAGKLKKHLSVFYRTFKGLAPADRLLVYRAFRSCMNTRRLFGDHCPFQRIDGLPAAIQKPAHDLFLYLYENTLDSVGDVKEHYEKFYNALPSNWCPFCAIERLHYYEHYKQDYDHLMPKQSFPFAAVNMNNLVPMGRDCNTVFKKTQDMLHDAAGNRRKAFYPFDPAVQITVSLQGSGLPTTGNRKGSWQITLLPDIEEVRTWNAVFKISNRYEKDLLQADYDSWLGFFRDFARQLQDIQRPWTPDKIKVAIGRYAAICPANDYREWRFIKHAVCQVWLNEADAGFYSALANSLT
jgi:hypothetical protein